MNVVLFIVLATALATSPRFERGFASFTAEYGRNYLPSELEYRQKVYALNMEWIFRMNQKGNSFTLGETPFADMTNTEFANSRASGCLSVLNQDMDVATIHETRPYEDAVDWREKGAVTAVKNQGDCGGCWAFAAAGSLEGRWFIKSGELKVLSEQNLIDCNKLNKGCNGGSLGFAFNYVKMSGICTEEDYPYVAKDEDCKKDKCTTLVKNTGHTYCTAQDGDSLKSAISTGPVGSAVQGSSAIFQHYKTGVIDSEECGTQVSHAVLAVGYAEDYVIIKNSWSAKWGEDGYVRIKWVKEGDGICGLNKINAYPKFD